MNATPSAAPAYGRLRLLLLLWVLPLLYGAIFFELRPSINNDVGMGLRVLEAMRLGAPFNTLIEPDKTDISKDVSRFVAAWSPSQFQLPALFQVDGLDLGRAIVLATTFCTCLGIAGWYTLYSAFGFSPRTSLLTCLLIEVFRPFLAPFYQYDGGEVVMFAAAPWCTLMVWRMTTESRPAGRFLLTAVAVSLATYGKLSGFIFITAVLGGAALRCWLRSAPSASSRERLAALRPVMNTLAPAALAWLLFLAGFYLLWISKGWTAVGQPHLKFELGSLYFPPVSAFVAVAGLNDAIGFAGAAVGPRFGWLFDQLIVYAVALPFCAAAATLVVRRARRHMTEATLFVLATCVLYSACVMVVFNYAYLYFDDRYLRSVSLLLAPCLVEAVLLGSGRFARVAAWSFVLALAGYGVLADVQHVVSVDRRPVGRLGFRHPVASAGLLAYLHDNFGPTSEGSSNRVVYVMSSEIPLEITGARVIAREADYLSKSALSEERFLGKVRELTVVLPTTFLANGKAEVILRSFRDYGPDGWRRRQIDDRFVAFSQ